MYKTSAVIDSSDLAKVPITEGRERLAEMVDIARSEVFEIWVVCERPSSAQLMRDGALLVQGC